MPWDEDTAAEAGRKSGEVRRRKASLTPEERALDAIGQKLGRLTNELIDAALGEGDFADLKLETRVSATRTLLEWKLGKAAAIRPKPSEEEEDPEAVSTPETLFG